LKYLIDTNICVYLLNGDVALKSRVAKIGLSSIAVSNSILAELYFGALVTGASGVCYTAKHDKK